MQGYPSDDDDRQEMAYSRRIEMDKARKKAKPTLNRLQAIKSGRIPPNMNDPLEREWYEKGIREREPKLRRDSFNDGDPCAIQCNVCKKTNGPMYWCSGCNEEVVYCGEICQASGCGVKHLNKITL